MTTERFNKIVEDQLDRIKNMLVKKAGEYNLEEDRLGFFKRAAGLAQITPEQALYGFLLKHIVSVSDMITSGKEYPKDLWLEKITDIENYLILLLGLIEDTDRDKEVSTKKATRTRLVEDKK